MDVIERLTKQGKDLGYEGETLQTFVKKQQLELRDERKAIAKREAEAKIEREKREAEMAMCEAEAKLERKQLRLKSVKLRRKHARLPEKHVRPKPLSVRPRQKLSVISVKLKSFLSVKN